MRYYHVELHTDCSAYHVRAENIDQAQWLAVEQWERDNGKRIDRTGATVQVA